MIGYSSSTRIQRQLTIDPVTSLLSWAITNSNSILFQYSGGTVAHFLNQQRLYIYLEMALPRNADFATKHCFFRTTFIGNISESRIWLTTMNSKNHLKQELNVSGDDIWQQKTTNGTPRNRYLGISSTPRNISRLWLKRPERNEVSIDSTVLYNPMNMKYPLGNVYITNWKITIFKFGKSTISMGHGFNSKL